MNPDRVVELDVLRRVALVSARVNSGQRLEDTLQAVSDGVVEALGFGVAVVNYRLPNGDFKVLAVTGPQAAAEELNGLLIRADEMQAILDRSEQWGELRYAPHEGTPKDEVAGWTPDLPVLDDPDAWHPEDMLLAPLHSATDTLVGVLAVDLPPGQRKPSMLLRELLEIFALQAGIAIDNARLHHDLQHEREELHLEQARLRASESSFRFAFTGSVSGMAMISLDPADLGRILQVNDAMCAMLGRTADELVALRWTDLVHDSEMTASLDSLLDLAQHRVTTFRGDRRMLRPDHTSSWLSVTGSVIDAGEGERPFMVMHAEDVTERRLRERRLRHEAAHDPLTGLPNRRLLLERLEAALDKAQRTGRGGVLLFCDLDRFKQINDHYGHRAGDEVLRETARRLTSQLRTRDMVARIGGDEFVIVAEDMDEAGVSVLCERIRTVMAPPFERVSAAVGVSVGWTAIDRTTPDVERVLELADSAMYLDKRSRSN